MLHEERLIDERTRAVRETVWQRHVERLVREVDTKVQARIRRSDERRQRQPSRARNPRVPCRRRGRAASSRYAAPEPTRFDHLSVNRRECGGRVREPSGGSGVRSCRVGVVSPGPAGARRDSTEGPPCRRGRQAGHQRRPGRQAHPRRSPPPAARTPSPRAPSSRSPRAATGHRRLRHARSRRRSPTAATKPSASGTRARSGPSPTITRGSPPSPRGTRGCLSPR